MAENERDPTWDEENPRSPARLPDRRAPKRVVVHSSERVFDGFFRIDEAIVEYERFDGRMSGPMRRLVFERGDAVAVLPTDRERRQVVLVRQFRYPAFVRDGRGWLWEIIAGMQDEGRDAESVARAEAMEEAGYELGQLRHVMTVYPSPGGSTERVHIYVAEIRPESRVSEGGGLPRDGEDILVRSFSLEEAMAMIGEGRIVDAKTVIALQHLALHWDEL